VDVVEFAEVEEVLLNEVGVVLDLEGLGHDLCVACEVKHRLAVVV